MLEIWVKCVRVCVHGTQCAIERKHMQTVKTFLYAWMHTDEKWRQNILFLSQIAFYTSVYLFTCIDCRQFHTLDLYSVLLSQCRIGGSPAGC